MALCAAQMGFGRPPQPTETLAPFPPPDARPPPPVFTLSPPVIVRVQPVAPGGRVARVLISFDQPMNTAQPPPLRLLPRPEGELRWLDPQTAVFEPASGFLPQATDYVATVAAGAPSATGTKLAQGREWRFSTEAPRVDSTTPVNADVGVDPLAPIVLRFNARMDLAELSSGLRLTAGGNPVQVRLSSKDGRSVEVRPVVALPFDAACELTLPKELRSTEGPKPLGSGYWLRFRTAAPPAILSATCGSSDRSFPDCNWDVVLRTNNPLPPQKLAQYVHIEPRFFDLRMTAGASGITLSGHWPDADVHVRVDPGVRDLFGQRTQQPFSVVVHEPPPVLAEAINGPDLFGPGDDPRLTLHAPGRGRALFRAARLLPEQLADAAKYVLHQGRDWPHFDRSLELAVADADVPLPLEGAGIWLVEVDLPATKVRSEAKLLRLAQVTSLQLVVASDETGFVVSARSSSDGAVVIGARLSLLDGKTATATSQTDARGMAQLQRPPERDPADPLILLGESAAERSILFVPKGRGDTGPQFSGGLWTERPVYRPGDTVHVYGILRGRGPRDTLLPAPKRVHWIAYDRFTWPRREFAQGDAAVGAIVSFDLTLPTDAPLGGVVVLLEEQHLSATFSVLEARPPSAKVSLTVFPGPHQVGGTAQALVSAATWFGAPLSGGRLRWSLTGWPGGRTARDDTQFTTRWDPTPAEIDLEPAESVPSLTHGETALDDAGSARLQLPLSPSCARQGPCVFSLEVEAIDSLQHAVAAKERFEAVRGAFDVGLRVKTSGRRIAAEARGLDQYGDVVPVPPIELQLFEVRMQADPGESRARSVEVEVARAMAPATLVAPHPGEFMVRATVPSMGAGGPRASTSASVSYEQPSLEVVADKATYSPGETAHLRLVSGQPHGPGLLVVDHGGIVAAQPVEAGATQVDVAVDPAWVPWVTAKVMLVSGARIDDAWASLTISRKGTELPVHIEPAEREYRPAETADVTVRSAPGVAVVLSVVDESALAMVRRHAVDPIAALYRSSNGADLSSTARLRKDRASRLYDELRGQPFELIDHRSGEIVVTGSRVRAEEVVPSPALRSDFRPTAFFTAALVTDAQGVTHARFRLPDQASTFQVFAFAAEAADTPRVGTATARIRTSLPLVVEPALPAFAVAGDRFQASAAVHNLRDAPLEAVVRVRGEGVEIDSREQKVSLPPHGSRALSFAVQAIKPGTARIRFEVLGADAAQLELPILRPTVAETFAAYGTTESAVQLPLAIPFDALPSEGGLQISLASSALQGLEDAAKYMLDYPYACAEQTASLLVSLAALRSLPVHVPGRAARMRAAVARLRELQNAQGGFGYWPGEPENPYATVWAAIALQDARSEVPDASDLLERVQPRLADVSGWPDGAVALSFAVVDTVPSSRAIADLFARRATLDLFSRALLLRALQQQSDARAGTVRTELLALAQETAGQLHFEDPRPSLVTFDSSDREDAVVLEALLETGEKGPVVEKLVRGLLATRQNGHWRTTQSTAWALRALSEYARRFEQESPAFTGGVWLGDKTLATHRFTGPPDEVARADVALAELPHPGRLVVGKEGEGRLHYRVGLTLVRPAADSQPLQHGFRVVRTFEDVDGHPLPQPLHVRAGEVVRVHLRLTSDQRRSYVALADRLPAGLETINPELATAASLPFVEQDWRWTHSELRERGGQAFADDLPSGTFEFTYFARAATKGRFAAPAAVAEEMYAPETAGRGELSELTVE
jgi:hypothetical protein